MRATNVTIRMDEDLKREAESLFNEMGMNISTAFNIFVRQAIRERAIPFRINLNQPNSEMIAAMKEAEMIARDENIPSYKSARDLFEVLDKED